MNKEQNFANHTRISTTYHIYTGIPMLAVVFGSFVNLYHTSHENLYSASLICAMSLILVSMFFHSRGFGLKAQDRAIRAEENFRHYVLTGKPLDRKITMSQVIALRFASDEELPALAEKAGTENLSGKQIKQMIKKWRADHYRV